MVTWIVIWFKHILFMAEHDKGLDRAKKLCLAISKAYFCCLISGIAGKFIKQIFGSENHRDECIRLIQSKCLKDGIEEIVFCVLSEWENKCFVCGWVRKQVLCAWVSEKTCALSGVSERAFSVRWVRSCGNVRVNEKYRVFICKRQREEFVWMNETEGVLCD